MSQQQHPLLQKYWGPSFDTLWDAYFQELVASAVGDRWQRIDLVTNLLVATTAAGSAIAGWALWTQEGWRAVWMLLAGFTSMMAIAHGVATVPARIKEQEELRQQFSRLRVGVETFRQQLTVIVFDPEKATSTLEQINRDYTALRDRYAEYTGRARKDLANTPKLRVKIKDELKERLKDAIRE